MSKIPKFGLFDMFLITLGGIFLRLVYWGETPQYFGAMIAFGFLYGTVKYIFIPLIEGDEEEDDGGR